MGVKKRVANRKLAEAYATVEWCELSFWIPDHFGDGGCPPASETHHIWGGTSGRTDLKSNLIRLSKPAHDWCERFKFDGRIVCLWVKAEKGELDPAEVRVASGFHLWGWLRKDTPKHPWVENLLFDLCAGEEFWQAAEAGTLDGDSFRARSGFGQFNWLEQAEAKQHGRQDGH
jgi:hypothetical protein